ncbi:hypothetical protein BGX23_000995 [Mortierella sp. AD031]|nr:hypothetical protein BGX23_000995 [Mortierella sp. AD031]
MLSFGWPLCWLSCTIVLLHAAPIPIPPFTPTPPPSTSTSAYSTAPSTLHIPSHNNNNNNNNEQKRSDIFSNLLKDPIPTSYPGLNLFPDLPSIPNVFVPMTSLPEIHPDLLQPPPMKGTPTGYSGDNSNRPNGAIIGNGIPIYPSMGFPDIEGLAAQCQSDRSPSLPLTFAPEVGIVRLFKQASFRAEAAVVRGCGCVALESPIAIESFVGSQNHSFAFYTSAYCEGDPFYQRFNQHYDVEPNMVANSIRIFHGVLPPLPGILL